MATVRLEFDLDSDLYPELHAALLRLGDAGLRGERIRQLAAAGLVWENVRIHGVAAIGPNPAAAPVPVRAAPPVPAPAPLPVLAAEVELPVERKPPRPKKTPARRRDDVRGADFVDLAISAEPAPPFVERRAAPRNLPVLMDVVADEEVEDSRTMALTAAAEPVPVPLPPPPLPPPPVALPDPVPHPVTAAVEPLADEAVILPVDPHHLASLAETPQRRSRLMRMKERGLFKNG
ncbi:hypothetical protein [Piscinibacter gummiphilus]|uniref:Uncharacterized protein n=1 Tax=Piscinibacter gummiphilus TaxID=946333 RepID=A0A1W6LFC6_9BURK|nr:hypothetical protein [Piscinibacter gummiphilus]ARN22888.1 hypothetical protein A4W93_24900 [Piscinibacter gummiphilus]ATU67587.1 hypothetical protein CPZ87_25035 [Piscinibacter gummiphilus]GLS96708.1 hypothetical protein GCM10007918_40000 [Piscinibacter gummiphilus]